MHCSRPSQYVLPLVISLAMDLQEEVDAFGLLQSWGHLDQV